MSLTFFLPVFSFSWGWGGAEVAGTALSRLVQRVVQERARLGDGGLGSVGVGQRVEHREVVDGARVARGCDVDAGRAQFARVVLALVSQDVAFAVDDERLREPAEFAFLGPYWADGAGT
jgi:hypothetical protein